jgi:hypothetical protein
MLVTLALLAQRPEIAFQTDSTPGPACREPAARPAAAHVVALKYPSRLELLRELAAESHRIPPCRGAARQRVAPERVPGLSLDRGLGPG